MHSQIDIMCALQELCGLYVGQVLDPCIPFASISVAPSSSAKVRSEPASLCPSRQINCRSALQPSFFAIFLCLLNAQALSIPCVTALKLTYKNETRDQN